MPRTEAQSQRNIKLEGALAPDARLVKPGTEKYGPKMTNLKNGPQKREVLLVVNPDLKVSPLNTGVLGDVAILSSILTTKEVGEFRSMNTRCDVSTCTCPDYQPTKKSSVPKELSLGNLTISSLINKRSELVAEDPTVPPAYTCDKRAKSYNLVRCL